MSESKMTLPPAPYDEEIDLSKWVRVLLAGKWLIIGITVAATVIAVIVALMLPNIYRAEALLAPNDPDSAGSLSSLAAQYGGLASLAGINLGGAGADKTAMGLEILKSRKFISEFIVRHDLLVPLLAAEGWDAETGELIIDPDDYDMATNKWIRRSSSSRSTMPSLQEAYEQFMKILSVIQNSGSGFVSISVRHYSPEVAKQWVDWLIDDLNAAIMHQDVAEAEQAIAYLHQQIASTSLADLQGVFFSMIEEQTKTVMLAKASNEYLL
ncbi:MAG: Wzz/FepE/Etk N-terminal domain-containing protein, partial [Gammaproteobacteria bacterium]|nr:Wzz/FepE/Etk N-terminal domain-containing protein [Gammaproteobacteria bacterium]